MLKAYVSTKTRLMDVADRLAALRNEDSGAALIEYALVVGLVAVVCVAALQALQGSVATSLNTIGGKLAAIK